MAGPNTPPTGRVTLTGSAAQRQVLVADSTVADADGLGTPVWSWERDTPGGWATIAGAIRGTYLLSQDDVGHTVRAVLSYTDGLGTRETVASDPTTIVANVNDAPSGEILLDGGAALQGVQLTATVQVADLDGLGSVSLQWQRGSGATWSPITGATATTYTPGQADVGLMLRAVASYTDGFGTAETVASAATLPIGNVNDAPTGVVAVSGVLLQGQRLSAANNLRDVDGLGTFAYRWQRDLGATGWQDIAGATAADYVPVQADVGRAIRAVISYTDQQGTQETVASAGAGPVANANDSPTGSVTVSGMVKQDQALTASDTLDDADGIGAVSYTWQRSDGRGGWISVPGGADPGYVPVQADVGFALRVIASYVDGWGSRETVVSAATVAVANNNDAPQGAVTVSGTPRQGEALQASAALTDPDGMGTVSWTWERSDGAGGWTVIQGATAARYVPVQADVGRLLRTVAAYMDQLGTAERVPSAATDFVGNVNDPATGTLSVTGTAIQGGTLTAAAAITDPDGMPAYTLQWQRLDDVADATSSRVKVRSHETSGTIL